MERPAEEVATSSMLRYNASKPDSKIRHNFANDLGAHTQKRLKEFHDGLQIELTRRKVGSWMQQDTGTKTGYGQWAKSISWGAEPDDESLSRETADSILKSIKDYENGERFYTGDEMLRMVEEE
ncbi:MAG: hypothetical protein OXP12_01520 [Thaumarchaeota archaeon]|nr:hypothetical protein [Nitrososphaerota archaeon]MDE0265718.1 hypothetical protein [Nitrososphaerota archaeon]MDE0525530.1 hypothetical protein [Nitrososphaerota archaeon]